MNEKFHAESAKIYPFPKRIGENTAENRKNAILTSKSGMPKFTATDFGSGWYHDAAMQAENPRKPLG